MICYCVVFHKCLIVNLLMVFINVKPLSMPNPISDEINFKCYYAFSTCKFHNLCNLTIML